MVSFPKQGYCESLDKDLINYLISRKTEYEKISTSFSANHKPIGIAWNENGSWYIYGKSQKPEYKIEQLLKIIKNQNNIIEVW